MQGVSMPCFIMTCFIMPCFIMIPFVIIPFVIIAVMIGFSMPSSEERPCRHVLFAQGGGDIAGMTRANNPPVASFDDE